MTKSNNNNTLKKIVKITTYFICIENVKNIVKLILIYAINILR